MSLPSTNGATDGAPPSEDPDHLTRSSYLYLLEFDPGVPALAGNLQEYYGNISKVYKAKGLHFEAALFERVAAEFTGITDDIRLPGPASSFP